MKLLIAIPALNEEQSIESIIDRCLAARPKIIDATPVTDVEITVISDGSTDRTVELARAYTDRVRLIVFPENRGYGAAILEAWRRSDAEWIGFLDADGTCDPIFFVPLCNALEERQADVVLGCRMNPASKMPWVRRCGNTLFALMLSVFSSKRVRDIASGMRVIRRSSLPRLMPLPHGLHFTPAMSARAILCDDLEIVEVDMPYHERRGHSKLNVFADGLRFFRVILESTFLYRPSRPLALIGALLAVIGAGLMVMPTLFYLRHGRVEEWMIYRFVVGHLAGSGAILVLCTGYLAGRISLLTLAARSQRSRGWRLVEAFLRSPFFYLVPIALAAAGAALVIPSFIELALTGATYEHWSRFIIMSLFLMVALILLVTRVVDYVLNLIEDRLRYLADGDPPLS